MSNLNFDKYAPTIEYPAIPKQPAILRRKVSELTNIELRSIPDIKRAYNEELDAANVARSNYFAAKAVGIARFRHDLEIDNGMSGHQKAEILWNKVWERVGDRGFAAVASEYEDLVDLVI